MLCFSVSKVERVLTMGKTTLDTGLRLTGRPEITVWGVSLLQVAFGAMEKLQPAMENMQQWFKSLCNWMWQQRRVAMALGLAVALVLQVNSRFGGNFDKIAEGYDLYLCYQRLKQILLLCRLQQRLWQLAVVDALVESPSTPAALCAPLSRKHRQAQ